MEKKVYEVPAAEIVLLREDIVAAQFSGWYNDGNYEGGIGECNDDDLCWGESV